MKKRIVKINLIGILCLSLWMTGLSGFYKGDTYAMGVTPPNLVSNLFPDGNLALAVANQLGVSTSTSVDQTQLDKVTFLSAIDKSIVDLTGIGYLKNLTYLDLSNNQIAVLPQEISSISAMKILTLSNNRLTMLPTSVFGSFSSMQKVMLDGNTLEDVFELSYLPQTCVKVSSGQILSTNLGTIDTNSPFSKPIQLPKIFNGQTISVNSTNASEKPTISTDGNGNKVLNISIGAVGTNTVTVRIDSGSSIYTAYSVVYSVINSVALKVPVINTGLNNTVTPSLRPYIYGTGIAGNSVMVLTDGKEDKNLVVVDSAGNWAYTPAVNLTPSKHVFTAKSKDITNTWSAASTSVIVTIDATAPAKPTITSALNNSTTNNVRIPITGTAEASSFVTLYIDAVEYTDCTRADSTGKWSYTPVNALSIGSHSFTAKVRDSVGNIGVVSTAVTITVDTTPPQIPTIDVAVNNAVLKLSKPLINGTGDVDSQIVVYLDSLTSGKAVLVDSTGKWKFTTATTLADGNHTVYAVAKDSAGNASGPSTVYNFSTDTVAPLAPTISAPVNNQITNITKPVFVGRSDLNTSVMVFANGKAISAKTGVDVQGNWTFTPTTAIVDGVQKITAKAYDAAGNESPVSATLNITIKTAPPPKPVIDSKMNGITTSNNRPVITGTAEAKAFITLNIDGNDIIDCAQADTFGKWTFTPDFPLADGKRTLSARAKDTFSNVGAFSTNVTITVDTAPPSVPVIDTSFDGALINKVKPEITGVSDPSVAVILLIDGVATTKSVKADASGKWKYVVETTLSEGTHQISAKSVDTAGNASAVSGAYPITINVTPPNMPRILLPGNNQATSDNKIVISGTADVNTKVILYLNNIEIAQVDVDASGGWTYKVMDGAKDGNHKITAKARNKANNISAASAAITVIIDTTPPKVPVITSPANGSVTSNQKTTIVGTAEAGAKITVKVDTIVYTDCSAADSAGKWSFTLSELLALGTHTISASAKDGLGNTGDFGSIVNLIIDTTAPVVGIGEIGSGNITNNPVPQISGTVKPNSKVYLRLDDKAIASPITADNEGKWKYKVATKLVEGSHSLTGTAVDTSGNASAAPTVMKFTVDLTAPAKPQIKNADPKGKTITNNPNMELSGKGEPDTNLVFYVDNKIQEDVSQTDADGNWTLQMSNPLEDGKHAIYIKAMDNAGNSSDKSDVLNLVVDTVAPKAPVLSSPKNKSIFQSSPIKIQGVGEIGSMLVVAVDDSAIELSQKLGAKGEFEYLLTQKLAVGKHTIAVSTKDEAENQSVTTIAAITIGVIKPSIPKAPVVAKPGNKSKTKDKRPTISGTAAPSATVTVVLKTSTGKLVTQLIVKAGKTGAWSVKPKTNLLPGNYLITLKAKSTTGTTVNGKSVGFTLTK